MEAIGREGKPRENMLLETKRCCPESCRVVKIPPLASRIRRALLTWLEAISAQLKDVGSKERENRQTKYL